jgi:hypothetical protein
VGNDQFPPFEFREYLVAPPLLRKYVGRYSSSRTHSQGGKMEYCEHRVLTRMAEPQSRAAKLRSPRRARGFLVSYIHATSPMCFGGSCGAMKPRTLPGMRQLKETAGLLRTCSMARLLGSNSRAAIARRVQYPLASWCATWKRMDPPIEQPASKGLTRPSASQNARMIRR